MCMLKGGGGGGGGGGVICKFFLGELSERND